MTRFCRIGLVWYRRVGLAIALLLAVATSGAMARTASIDAPAIRAESPPPARVSGRVTGAAGAPLASAQVSLSSLESNGTLAEVTDTDGSFTFSRVVPGRYRVTVTWRHLHANSDEGLQFEAGEDYTLDLPMVAAPDNHGTEAYVAPPVSQRGRL